MKKVIKLTESDLMRIVKRVITEDLAHKQKLYTSWATKKSGNPEAAMKIMDDVLNYQKKLPKKDFANYSSYEELATDINKIKKELKSQDATKLYEDSELVVLAPNTWEASCKYGAGSKWCTTAKDTDSHWDRHNKTGTEFFWIFKNKPQSDPNYKYSYHIKIDGGADWCNAVNTCRNKLPKNAYPLQHPKYEEILTKLQEFHNSRDYVKNYESNRTQSEVITKFIETGIETNYDEFIRMFDLENNFLKLLENRLKNYDYEYGFEMVGVDLYEVNFNINDAIDYVEENIDNDDLLMEILTGNFVKDLSVIVERVTFTGVADAFHNQLGIAYIADGGDYLNPNEPVLPQLETKGFINLMKIIPKEEIDEIFDENGTEIIYSHISDLSQEYISNIV